MKILGPVVILVRLERLLAKRYAHLANQLLPSSPGSKGRSTTSCLSRTAAMNVATARGEKLPPASKQVSVSYTTLMRSSSKREWGRGRAEQDLKRKLKEKVIPDSLHFRIP